MCSLSYHSTIDEGMTYLRTLAKISQMQVLAIVLVGVLLIAPAPFNFHQLLFRLLKPYYVFCYVDLRAVRLTVAFPSIPPTTACLELAPVV